MQTYGHQHKSSLYSEYFSLDLCLKLKCTGIVSPFGHLQWGCHLCPTSPSGFQGTSPCKACPVTRRANKGNQVGLPLHQRPWPTEIANVPLGIPRFSGTMVTPAAKTGVRREIQASR